MDIFIGRQGIYDRESRVVAYELLYRNSLKNSFSNGINENLATSKVIQNISSIGLDRLVSDKQALVNFPEDLINANIATLLPKEKVIIEVLETVKPTLEVLKNLKLLKKLGYSIALDDVYEIDQLNKFIEIIDIVKVDFLLANKKQIEQIVYIAKKHNIKLLAEKIENEHDLKYAMALGFEYFQGYYYSKPCVIFEKDIAIKNVAIFSTLSELLIENYNLDKVENIMKSDVGISYKFLRFINSAYFNFMNEIDSIKQAIMLIGKEELRKWLFLLSMVEIASGKSDEYANLIVIRAKVCEGIMSIIDRDQRSIAFMVGLFSDLHLMIEREIDYVVAQLPLNTNAKKALMGEDNVYKKVLDLALACELVDNNKIIKICSELNIKEEQLFKIYVDSVDWIKNIYK